MNFNSPILLSRASSYTSTELRSPTHQAEDLADSRSGSGTFFINISPGTETRPSSARRSTMSGEPERISGLASPRQQALQRALPVRLRAASLVENNHLVWLGSVDDVNSWPLSPQVSGLSTPRSEASDDAVTRLVYTRHDILEEGLNTLYPEVVQAVAHVVGDIFSRTEQPRAARSGEHTPLWREKVEELDANFMDRVLVLTLARRLPQLFQSRHTGLEYFDVERATRPLAQAHRLARDLVESLCASVPAALLGGSDNAPRNALAAVVRNVEQGLETHSWAGADPRYAALGNALVAAVSHIERPDRSAMVHAAIKCFNQTL